MEMNNKKQDGVDLMSLELNIIADLLENAANEFSQHECNDFVCRASEENKEIISAVMNHYPDKSDWGDGEESWEEYAASVLDSESEIYTFDHWVMSYFSHRCKALAENPSPVQKLSSAELNILAQLLAIVSDEHREHANINRYDYTLASTDENKAFFLTIIDSQGELACVENINEIVEAKDEITMQDFHILSYLSDKCHTLSSVVNRL